MYHRFLYVLVAFAGPVLFASANERPNIVVFYTDDHGYADLSCQGVFDDIHTPHVDALARNGVRALHGYSTAPQCVPSRAGLMVGKFQSKFGVESNGADLSGFDRELTIAERLQAVGYMTAQFGKWHLGPAPQITQHGFKHVFSQNSQRPFFSNVTLDGRDQTMSTMPPGMYHVDGCSQAAASLIRRYQDVPFFLYIAYRAPHVPLDAPQKYLDRFPGQMPERRRQALAMLSAVDDGVGLITDTLAECGLTKKTLIFYIGDNGAPLKIHKRDAPGGGPGWDGSLNDPLNGEKGMLAEGGMHTPFVISWPGRIPGGQAYPHPISALDVAATAAGIAGLEIAPHELDGVNLIPYLTGEITSSPHDFLAWRWVAQSAIRQGDWKLLRGGDREYLYDLGNDIEEQRNLADDHPEIAAKLRAKLTDWSSQLDPPGLAKGGMSAAATSYFDFYLDGKPAPPPTERQPNGQVTDAAGWVVRNGRLERGDDGWRLLPADAGKQQLFITRNGLSLTGPVVFKMVAKTSSPGDVSVAWREKGDKEFTAACRQKFAAVESADGQRFEGVLSPHAQIIHVRIQVPDGVTTIKSVELRPARGKPVTLTQE